MSNRIVYITKGDYVSHKLENMYIEDTEGYITVPLEDIKVIVIDNLEMKLSSSLLYKLCDYNICTIITNDKHTPIGQILPISGYHADLERIQQQIHITKPFKKNLWRKIIIKKIENQAEVLNLCEYTESSLFIKNKRNKVLSGDSSNQEGVVASLYFRILFGHNFTRDTSSVINSMLDYGYSILRSAIARELVASGYIGALGIHHKNIYNSFNLADDLIEPFRPIVDLYVKQNLSNVEKDKLERDTKIKLVQLLHYEVIFNNTKTTVFNAIRECIRSLTTSIKTKNINKFLLPQICSLKLHKYE